MNALAIVSIAFGLLVIVTRGPLIFAPKGTVRVFLDWIDSTGHVRVLAVGIAVLGLAALGSLAGVPGTLATVIEVIAWWCVAGGVFLLYFPALYQRFARSFLEAFDVTALRLLGVLGVSVGGLFVYLGAAAG